MIDILCMEERTYNDPVSLQNINPFNALIVHMPDLAMMTFILVTGLAMVVSGAFGWYLMYGAVFVAGFHYIWFVGKRHVPRGNPGWKHIGLISLAIGVNAAFMILMSVILIQFAPV